MSVCEQSGEARRAEDSDFGEPSELYSGAFFEEENRSLPLTDDEVDEICESQPRSIVLLYVTLDIDEATLKPSLPTTIDIIQHQKDWEAQTLNRFDTRGYSATSRHSVRTTPYPKVWWGLETLMSMYHSGNMNSYQDAFQARTELSQAKLIPDLCILRTILEPKETVPIGDCSRAEPLTPPRSATPAPRKRRLSNAFPSDHDSKAKRIRLDA